MGTGIGGHHRAFQGISDDWCTPPEILAELGKFNDDPCPVGGTDGLIRVWKGRVFLNPPYGPQTGIWLKRLVEHGNGIALIYARTETKMFFQQVWEKATAVLFIAGRLYFYTPDGKKAKHNSGGPSVLIAYGEYNAKVLREANISGCYVSLLKSQIKY